MADNEISGTENANGVPQLKPCPFCGGEAVVVHKFADIITMSGKTWGVCCLSDLLDYDGEGKSHNHRVENFDTEAEAIEAWNTRAVEVCEIVGFADAEPLPIIPERTCHEVIVDKHWRGCSECSYKWEFMYGIAKCERPNYCPQCGARVVE